MALRNVFVIKETKWSRPAVERFLSDPEVRKLEIFISPVVMPGTEDWEFYQAMIEPVAQRLGWTMVGEGSPELGDIAWRTAEFDPGAQVTPELEQRFMRVNSKSEGAYIMAPQGPDIDRYMGKGMGNISAGFGGAMDTAMKKRKDIN